MRAIKERWKDLTMWQKGLFSIFVMVVMVLPAAVVIEGRFTPVSLGSNDAATALLQKFGAEADAQLNSSPVFAPFNVSVTHPGVLTAAALEKSLDSIVGTPYESLVRSVPQAMWNAELNAVLGKETQQSMIHTEYAGIPGWGNAVFLAEQYAVLGATVAACAISVGLVCIGLVIVLALQIALQTFQCQIASNPYFSWLVPSCTTPSGNPLEATNNAIFIADTLQYLAGLQANAESNLMQALNLTYVALSYEAANGAVSQLKNNTYNPELDLAQSGVATQLASVFYSEAGTLQAIMSIGVSLADAIENNNNYDGYYCPIAFGQAGGGGFVTPGTAPVSCAASFGSAGSLQNLNGSLVGGWAPINVGSTTSPGSCPVVYLQSGSTISVVMTASVGTLTLIPAYDNTSSGMRGTGWDNITMAENWASAEFSGNITLSLPYGGANGMAYYVCGSNHGVQSIMMTYGIPLNPSTWGSMVTQSPDVYYFCSAVPAQIALCQTTGGSPWTIVASSTNQWACVGGYIGTSDCLYSAGVYGTPSNTTLTGLHYGTMYGAGTGLNLGTYLESLLSYCTKIGWLYWYTIHVQLGKTSVPITCLIPNPAQLFPPNIALNELLTASVTTLTNWYDSELTLQAQTFNPNATLTSITICGKHPTAWNPYNTALGFGVYGIGYVYVPGATKSSDGKVAQVFSSPTTWNISGAIFIVPTISSLAPIPVNTSFELPLNNPTSLYVQPFMYTPGTGGGQSLINRSGPLGCFSRYNPTNGCLQIGTASYATGYVMGNSSAGGGLIGSTYPNSIDVSAGTGAAVYLTGCEVATVGSPSLDPYYNLSRSCNFAIQQINETAYLCNGQIVHSGQSVLGSCPTPPCTLCGIVTNTNGCDIVILSSLDAAVNPYVAEPWACLLAWIIVIVVVLVIIWAVVAIINRPSRR